jgi:hypothetical protein
MLWALGVARREASHRGFPRISWRRGARRGTDSRGGCPKKFVVLGSGCKLQSLPIMPRSKRQKSPLCNFTASVQRAKNYSLSNLCCPRNPEITCTETPKRTPKSPKRTPKSPNRTPKSPKRTPESPKREGRARACTRPAVPSFCTPSRPGTMRFSDGGLDVVVIFLTLALCVSCTGTFGAAFRICAS